MKLNELIQDEETKILLAPMNEMANLYPSDTGISYVIWFGEVGGQHGPRIKVSNVKNKFAINDNFVIAVEKEPRVMTPKSCKLKKDEVDDVKDWIRQNYDDLMLMWKIHETGNSTVKDKTGNDVHLNDILVRLKKI